jgi:hypothetical protein
MVSAAARTEVTSTIMANTVVIASPTGGYSSTPKLVHGNSVIVGQCTVQLLSRAGMWRENV